MPSLEEFFAITFWNNTLREYAIFLSVFVLLFSILKTFDSSVVLILKKYAKKTKIKWDDMIIDFINALHWQFYAYLSFYVAAQFLHLPQQVDKAIFVLLLAFLIFYISQGLSRVVDHLTIKQIEKRKKADNAQNTSMIRVFGNIFKGVIWVVAILMFLSNIGVEITPLVASLGVGGIAIAIALQSVLGDLFSAFAIYFDKPFKEGDFIVVGNDMGTVKSIGIKTTRIETLQGQELIMSNSDLTSSRVNNYQTMKRRRIVMEFGVEYNTPLKKLKKINSIVKKVLDNVKDATLDRIHFKKFGDFSLNYEVVYYVESPDYNKYMDIQQEINFAIKEQFEKENIEFAFPTQTIHLQR